MSLLMIEPQPNFPHEDLSDINASFLELLLANKANLEQTHHVAENSSRLFRVGHRGILFAMAPHVETSPRIDAISTGTATYEAISATVRLGQLPAVHNSQQATDYFTDDAPALTPLTLLSDVREAFCEQMPRTSSVIKETAARTHQAYIEYVLAGAALARMAEIDVTGGAI